MELQREEKREEGDRGDQEEKNVNEKLISQASEPHIYTISENILMLGLGATFFDLGYVFIGLPRWC